MSQRVTAARKALMTLIEDAVANKVDPLGEAVWVTNGPPTGYAPPSVVTLMNISQPIEKPAMGTSRPRRRNVEFNVGVSISLFGDELVVEETADFHDELVDLIEDALRESPGDRLSGAAQAAWLSRIEGPNAETVADPESQQVVGRIVESVLTITAIVDY